MANWRAAIKKWFNENDDDGSLFQIAPPGNTPERISEAEAILGVEIPVQMRELYSAVDGFDLCPNSDDKPVFVKCLDGIPKYADQERGYLADTHADFAKGYLPFIDFGNGDSAGYIWISNDGERIPILVMVEHEKFNYDPEQPIAEFVSEMPELQEMFPSN